MAATIATVVAGCAAAVPSPAGRSRPPVVQVEPEPSAEATQGPRRFSVDSPVAAASLVRALCEAAESEDRGFITQHARLPLRGHEIVVKANEAPQVHGVGAAEKPTSLRDRAMCRHRPAEDAELADFRLTDTTARGIATLDGHRYRLVFERSPPRLVEQSYVVADVPLPARAPTDRPFHIDVDPRSDHGPLDHRLAARARGYLMAHPHCIEAQAQREPVGLSMLVTVETSPGRSPEVNLYASTMGPVAYVGCLQAQLRPALSEIVAEERTARLHQLWAMVGIVVYDHEIPEDAATIEMVGPED